MYTYRIMSRYVKRFWQMNDEQRATAKAIEARLAPWRTALVKVMYACTPRWLLWALIIVFCIALFFPGSPAPAMIIVYILITLALLLFGGTGLAQGWSFSGEMRRLFTGFVNTALSFLLLAFAVIGIVFVISGVLHV